MITETGVVRRIDDLGRVVVPKSMRAVLGIQEGDPLELYIVGKEGVLLRQYHEDRLPPVILPQQLSPAIGAVISERYRQDAKWGEQNHELQFWMGILMEEVGELAQAVNETVFNNGPEEQAKGGYANMRAEAVQVAAVAVAFVEMLDRRFRQ
jgi:AbrB family looped-hinge helix DNA binding protein